MFMRVRRVLHVHVPSHAPATGQTLSIRTASLLRSRDDLPQPQIMTLPSSRKVNVKCSWQCMRVGGVASLVASVRRVRRAVGSAVGGGGVGGSSLPGHNADQRGDDHAFHMHVEGGRGGGQDVTQPYPGAAQVKEGTPKPVACCCYPPYDE